MTGVPAPPGWWRCGRYACTDLPLHTHVQVPFTHVPHLFSATHRDGVDIDRIWVDWAAVARELWTQEASRA